MSQKSPHSFLTLILVLGSLTAFGPLSIDMYLPALPNIADSYKTSLSSVQLSLASFFVGLSIGQILMGPITDRFGRKPPLIAGLIIYGLASAACARSFDVDQLILFRFFQALGACGGMVISRAVVCDLFNQQESARVFSLLILVMGVAPILAPILGGLVTEAWNWRAIFWLLAGLSTLSLVAVSMLLPETHTPNPNVQFKSVFKTYFSIARDRQFLGYALAGGAAQAGMFAYITGSPFVFIEYYGIPSHLYGWAFGANALGLIFLSQVNGRLLKAQSFDRILNRVFILLAVFSTAVTIVGWMDLGYWSLAIPLFGYIAFLGMTFPNSTAGALAEHRAHAGSASALLGTFQFIIAALSSTAVSHFHNGTDKPMTTLIGFCGVTALLIYYALIYVPNSRLLKEAKA